MNLKFKQPSNLIEFELNYGDVLTRDDIIKKSGLIVLDDNDNDMSDFIVVDNHTFDNGVRVKDSFSYQVSWSIVIDGDEEYTGNNFTMNVTVIEEEKEQPKIIVSELEEKAIDDKSIILGDIIDLGKTPGDYFIPMLKVDLSKFNNVDKISLNVYPIMGNGNVDNYTDLAFDRPGSLINEEFVWNYDDETKFPFSDDSNSISGLMYKLVIFLKDPVIEKQSDPWNSVIKSNDSDTIKEESTPVLEVEESKVIESDYYEDQTQKTSYVQFNEIINEIVHPLNISSYSEGSLDPVDKKKTLPFGKRSKKESKSKKPKIKKDKVKKENSKKGLKSFLIYAIILLVLLGGAGFGGYRFYSSSMKSIEPTVQEVDKNLKEASTILSKDSLSSDDVSKLSVLLNSNESSLNSLKSKNYFIATKRSDLVLKNNELVSQTNERLNSSDKNNTSDSETETSDSK